jgi:hypothetical protein
VISRQKSQVGEAASRTGMRYALWRYRVSGASGSGGVFVEGDV